MWFYNLARGFAWFIVFVMLLYIGLIMMTGGNGWLAIGLLAVMIAIIVITLRADVKRKIRERRSAAEPRPVMVAAAAYVPPAERPAFPIMMHDGQEVDVFNCNPITLERV